MEKRIKLFNRAVQALLGGALLFGLLFIVSCDNGDDPEPELYSFPGVYIFNEATLQTQITINVGIPITIPVGTDITDEMSDGLLAEGNCDDSNNSAVELKDNNELFFACRNESNELRAGTWSINTDTTELSLNLTSPPLPAPLSLTIQELEIVASTDIIQGSILNFPLTPDLMLGFLPSSMTDGKTQEELDALKELFDPVTLVNVDIAFKKVSE